MRLERAVRLKFTPNAPPIEPSSGSIKTLRRSSLYGYMLRALSGKLAVLRPWSSRWSSRKQYFEMSRSRLQVFYVGNVQGIGFRYTVKALAAGFEVTGTVRNLPDGRVELAAEGLKGELSAFQQAIRESELGHFIRKEEVTWAEPQGGFRGFEIAR